MARAGGGRLRYGGGSAQGKSMGLYSGLWFMGPVPALRHGHIVLLLFLYEMGTKVMSKRLMCREN